MNRCPAELWIRIFALACTDGGYTGRSLSCVSRYISDVSRPVQLQSVALHGAYELKCFADTMESRVPEDRRILHLYIAHHKEPSDRNSYAPPDSLSSSELREALIYRLYHPADEAELLRRLPDEMRGWPAGELTAERDQVFRRALDRVMQVASIHLQTFTLHIGSLLLSSQYGPHFPSVLARHDFPRLEELTILDTFVLRGGLQAPHYKRLPEFPSLKRLHLVDCYNYLVAFLGSVPSLTHLRMSGVTQLFPDLSAIVRGVIDPDATTNVVPTAQTGLVHLQKIIVSPVSQSRTATYRVITEQALKQMARCNDKLILLRSDRAAGPPYGLPEARRDWLQRIEGEEGCWGYRTLDRDPETIQGYTFGY